MQKYHSYTGFITPILLTTVFAASIVLFALANLVVNQYGNNQRKTALQVAQTIAEAGINTHAWQLSHNPTDYTSNTNAPIDFKNSVGEIIGQYQVTVTPPQNGSNILTLTSMGWSSDYPDITYTMTTQYGKPSFARYSILYDSEVWIPSNFTINGPFHSNGGIRNDGINTSTVTSSVTSYTCTHKNANCSPPETKPGVWGNGGDQTLWSYPAPAVDFDSISIDYPTLKTTATNTGLYLGPTTVGYHLTFNQNGTFSVYRVSATNKIKGGKGNPGCEQLDADIKTQNLISTHNTADIDLIFVEDTVWVEGTVTAPITIVAAEFPLGTKDTIIWIKDTINYPIKNGSIQLGLISQKDIYIHRDVSNNLEIDGALFAQTGQIMRHDYSLSCAGNPANAIRNSLTLYGSLISKQQSQWNWGTSVASGFQSGTITYDSNLEFTPPPYFPTTNEYQFIN